MGEHGTWFDYLSHFEWWNKFNHWAGDKLHREAGTAMFPSGFTLNHVLMTLLVVIFVAIVNRFCRGEGKRGRAA